MSAVEKSFVPSTIKDQVDEYPFTYEQIGMEIDRAVVIDVKPFQVRLWRPTIMERTICTSYRDLRDKSNSCMGCTEFESCKVDRRIKHSNVFEQPSTP